MYGISNHFRSGRLRIKEMLDYFRLRDNRCAALQRLTRSSVFLPNFMVYTCSAPPQRDTNTELRYEATAVIVAFGIDSNCVAFTVFFSISLDGYVVYGFLCFLLYARPNFWDPTSPSSVTSFQWSRFCKKMGTVNVPIGVYPLTMFHLLWTINRTFIRNMVVISRVQQSLLFNENRVVSQWQW